MRYLLFALLLISTNTHAQNAPFSISIDSVATCPKYSHMLLLQGNYTNNTPDTLFLVKEKTQLASFTWSDPRDVARKHSKDNIFIIDSTQNKLVGTYAYIDSGKPFTAPELLECLGPVLIANQKLKTRKIAARDCFVFPPHTTLHLRTAIKTLPEDDIAFKNFTDADRTTAQVTLKYHLIYYINGQSIADADVTPTIPAQLPDAIRKLMYWH
ncbi:MAG: hypothetical protein EOP51_03435 [Sphingobacteriales bacterium]|nr:MAG: hypothetical protein EOP51_03435 [Sphingobacteriales bacterium]